MTTACFDIGNSRAKLAIFDGDKKVVDQIVKDNPGIRMVNHMRKKYAFDHLILSSTRNLPDTLLQRLNSSLDFFIQLNHRTPLPVKNLYESPESLGMDRIAGTIGAWKESDHSACMLIDAGTCITYDVIDNNGQYRGGNISPGLEMRLRSMHAFTDKLPLAEVAINENPVGLSTVKALQNGAFYGAIGEIDSFIRRFSLQFGSLKVFLTGGDASIFAEQIESKIFVRPYLVLKGLNEILHYNAV